MDLKVEIFQTKWTPTNELRFIAYISKETQFHETISKVSVLSGSSTDVSARGVEGVCAYDCKLLVTIPTNLQDFFPSMIGLGLVDCGLKTISRKGLKGLKQLKEFAIVNSKIEVLPSDLLADLTNLEIIELFNNQIRVIGKFTFKVLKKVKYIDLRGNPGISASFASGGLKQPKTLTSTRIETQKFTDLEEFIAYVDSELSKIHKPKMNARCKEDYTIYVGEVEFKANKTLIMNRCLKLAEWIENHPGEDKVGLEEIEANVFEEVLYYIKHGSLPKIGKDIWKIYAAAAQLKINMLKNYAAANLTDENQNWI